MIAMTVGVNMLNSMVTSIRKMSRVTFFFLLSALLLVGVVSLRSADVDIVSLAHDRLSLGGERSAEPVEEEEELHKHRRFSLVIPATSPSPDLCKTVTTALALGYPSPVIINWGVDFHKVTKWDGGRNLPKIPGFVQYLDAVLHPEAHPDERLDEDDLVLMVDAYDVWFQLPAEVLLRRYHEINDQANARLLKLWDQKGPMPMKQTIVAASGKNCHPQPSSGSDLHCDKIPESPLRWDLYGPETEKNETKHRDHRPRYINGGLYIGPAGDMRRLFRRALEKMEAGLGKGVHLFSEQGVPGEVLGEQEVWRQWRREGGVSSDDAEMLMDRDFEFHFGLDYYQTLSVQTFWTDTEAGLFDGAFVKLNNKTAIAKHSKALGISPVRLKGVPKDVSEAWNPLDGYVKRADWGEMRLYADFFTESVPAIVHHNGFKERRTQWWTKPWFHRFLREMVSARLASEHALNPVGTVEQGEGSTKYWLPAAEASERGVRLAAETAKNRFPMIGFGDLCHFKGQSQKHWWDEVFRDDKGPM